ncbi:MAG: site-specific DNA-methyltransferase [Clostridia bacterium]|nr:site-specific DNA-methyltransferase [Clostridia bacterium]
MDKLKMKSMDKVQENIQKIRALFPNAVTEVLRDGEPTLAVDFDILKQEMSNVLVDDKEQRYQFTWPDKNKSILLANTPISATLRPCKEESVDFDNTQNLYIEGDNLEVLKLLQETYLGKIKMIYIDPPYNTGNDFVYNDDFSQDSEEYLDNSGQYDEYGNRLVQNTESNGRFHTDWLNMIYPRLRLAKDLLSDDGVIFISIDDNEVENLRKTCDEIFGESNFVAMFPWRKRTAKSDVPFGVSQDYEWVLVYAKSQDFSAAIEGGTRKYFDTNDFPGRPWRIHDLTTQRNASERPNSNFTMINPKTGKEYPANPNRTWAVTIDTFDEYYKQGKIVFPDDYDFLKISQPAFRYFKDDDEQKAGELFGYIAVSTNLPKEIGMTKVGTADLNELFDKKIFGFPKPVALLKYFISITTKFDKDAVILDFFSGSATTAHAVIQLNAEDGGNRKFIMVQLPESCDENSEAHKAGYKNICEIGKERIRRAGKKILEIKNGEQLNTIEGLTNAIKDKGVFALCDELKMQNNLNKLDTGFRVLKLDSSNMKDVYYRPEDYNQTLLDMFEDNIKEDRTPLDLLFQVMLDLGKPLSAKIEEKEIAGKHVFIVDGNDLIACFDKDITDEVVKTIAQMKPLYAVFRDSSMANDSVGTNFEQIFATYSPNTTRKVL